jgi:hypothetical protein
VISMKRWLCVIPLLLAIAVYLPALWGDFVWDDAVIFERQLVAIDGIGDVLFPPDGIWGWTYVYYRPIVVLSYLLDVELFGRGSAVGPHLSNLIYHVIATFCVWFLAKRLFLHLSNGTAGATVAASIFAVHPIHTESVSWIAGRADVLATMFLLPSIILILVWRDRREYWALVLAAVLFLLALLSKEPAIAALVLVPATILLAAGSENQYESGRGESPLTSNSKPFNSNAFVWAGAGFAYLGATAVYIILRKSGATDTYEGLPVLNWGNSIWDFVVASAYYFVKLLAPWSQSNMVTWDMLPGSAVATIVSLIVLGMAVFGFRRWAHCRDGILLLAVLWITVSLVPSLFVAVGSVAGMVNDTGRTPAAFPVAERYLYLPSVGLVLVLGYIYCEIFSSKWRRPALAIAIAFIGVYAIATLQRGMVWNNNVRLWTDATEKVPNHGSPWNELGRAYVAIGDDESALPAFKRSLELSKLSNSRFKISHNIGTTYLRQRELDKAETYFRIALGGQKDLAEPHYGLGLMYTYKVADIYAVGGPMDLIRENVELAIGHYESAIRINPNFHLAQIMLARILADYGRVLAAIGNEQAAVALYRSAMNLVDEMLARIPVDEREQYLKQWQEQVNINVYELRARIEQALGDMRL